MKKQIVILIISAIIISCSNTTNGNKIIRDSTNRIVPTSDSNSLKSVVNNSKNQSNIPDFLLISARAKESYQGYLQGVEKNDSSGPYVIREFISDTLSFDLIFFPKNFNNRSVDFETINKASTNNYNEYVCFAFEYPMKYLSPSDPDYHSDNTPYPVSIKGYVRKENIWSFISEQKVRDLTELSRYEIQTMFRNIH